MACEHDGAAVLFVSFFQGLPSSLLLENSEKDRFLLLPSATLPGRPESKVPCRYSTLTVAMFTPEFGARSVAGE